MAPNRMRVRSCSHAPILFLSQLCQIALHSLCIFTFVALSVPLAANEPFLKQAFQRVDRGRSPAVSVKPTQAAVERLISLDEKWDPYRQGIGLEPGSKPTNIEESWYNPADEIIVVVTLKHPGSAGASFLDFGILSALSVCLCGGANSEPPNS